MGTLGIACMRHVCSAHRHVRLSSLLRPLQCRWLSKRSQRGWRAPPSSAAALDDAQPSTRGRTAEEEEAGIADYLDHCHTSYTITGKNKDSPDLVTFGRGPGGLPCAQLHHPSGARAEVCLHGAAVTSWRRADGHEMLYLRPDNTFNGTDPIRGGVGVAWPQMGVGALPPMGLLGTLCWSVVETSSLKGRDPCPSVSLYAESDEASLAVWPHRFEAVYTVTLMQPSTGEAPDPRKAMQAADEKERAQVAREMRAAMVAACGGGYGEESTSGGSGREVEAPPRATGFNWQKPGTSSSAAEAVQAAGAGSNAVDPDEPPPVPPSQLRCVLQVSNGGDGEMAFTAGLLPHFATEDICTHSKIVKVLGLGGKYVLDYGDNPMQPKLQIEQGDFLFFDPKGGKQMDRLYVDCTDEGQVLFCPGTRHHFDVRNIKGFSDIEVLNPAATVPSIARRCVCVAPARKARPVRLAPGESWYGEAQIAAYNDYWPLPPFEKDDPSTVPLAEVSVPPMRQWTSRGIEEAIYEDAL